MPNHYVGDLPHTIGISGLSRVRTELVKLAVVIALTPHPVQMHRQLARHCDLGNLPSSAHGQVERREKRWSTAGESPARELVRSKIMMPIFSIGTPLLLRWLRTSPDQQWTLLSIFWERLRVPSMVAALETIVAAPEVRHQLLRDAAIQRLYELDPEEATPYILDEIKHPHIDKLKHRAAFSISARVLGPT
jgi:hypothetical protein